MGVANTYLKPHPHNEKLTVPITTDWLECRSHSLHVLSADAVKTLVPSYKKI